MDYSVFISYRRQGGAHYARILKAELERRGYRVFLDYDELNDGRFDSRIMQAIESAPVFIFILSPGSLDRCVNEDDWVRHEIVYAMKTERNIVPVNFDGLFKAFPASLPEDVRSIIGQHQFSKIDSESLLQESVDKLVRNRIAPIVSPYNTGTTDTANGAEIFVLTDAECSINRFHKLLTVARPDEETSIRLNKGNHLLEFISTENPDIREQVRYTVTDNDYSDFIEIHLRKRIDEALELLSLFPVRKNGRYGYIDIHGNLRIRCQFYGAGHFSEGMAKIRNEKGLWGFIDKTGKTVIPCIFRYENSHSEEFSNGLDLCVFMDGNIINLADSYTSSFNYADLFTEGLARVKNKDGLFGFIDRNGNSAIPCSFKFADFFSDGLAMVQNKDGLFGYIDRYGNMAVPCSFKDAHSFIDGLARVQNNDRLYGYIDKNGKMVVPCSFEDSCPFFSEGLASVRNKKGLYGFIDKNGKFVIPCSFKNVGFFCDGLTTIQGKEGLWGYIDKNGKQVIPCTFKNAAYFSDGLACVQNKEGLWGFIDKNGIQAIPCSFEYAYSFSDGLGCVKNAEGLWGAVDKNGNLVIPFRYKKPVYFKDGLAEVESESGLAYINKKGEIVWSENDPA